MIQIQGIIDMSLSLNKPATTCAKCFHIKEAHHDGVCMGDLSCQCFKFEEPFLFEFAQRVEEEKHIRKSIYNRVQYILENIPQTRNAGEKTFYKIFIESWYGFKIRKEGMKMSTEVWERLPNQDSVSREKRRVKHDHPELATYDKTVLQHQNAIFMALLEMSYE